jgi:hypothetical protein
MGAIQIEFRQIQIVLDGQDTLLPELFQTAIVAPVREVEVDRTVADFFFSEPGTAATGISSHWQPVCSQYRM